MAVTPGSATQMNKLFGAAKVVYMTTEELTTFEAKVFEKGLLLITPEGKTLRTDGVTALKELAPVIDQVLVKIEKDALVAAFGTGAYVRTAGGVVAHGADGMIDDASLKLVADGKLVDSYVAHFFDGTKVKLEALPDSVRAGVAYVATFEDLAGLGEEAKRGLVFVIDASGDPDTTSGGAMYAWNVAGNKWVMIAEQESLNIDINALTPSYANVQAAGAVMYDHPLMLEAPTLTQLVGFIDA